MKHSIVLSTQPAQFQAATFKGDLENNLMQIASLGYDGVELAIRDPKLIDLDSMDQMVRKYNLGVPAIGTGQAWGEEGLSFTDPNPEIRAAAIQRIISHIPVAERLDAVIILGLIRGIVKPGADQSQAMEWLVDAIKECSAAALPHGIRLALEPINRYETSLINNTTQGLDLIKSVGAENFGLLLDTFHMNIEEANIESSIQASSEKIFHFHIADSNRWYPGAGHLDFESILQSLSSTKYQGWISGEFLPIPDSATAAERSMVHVRKINLP